MNNSRVSTASLCYGLLLAIGSLSVLLYLYVAFGRLFYPYQIEWIEGGIFQQVIRITQGYTLYGTPTMESVPALYTPLYHYLAASLTAITGKSLFTLRLVSLLSSLLTCAALACAIRILTRSWWPALLAMCCYLATYRFTGFWFDVGRVDSLWVVFLAWSVVTLVMSMQKQSMHAVIYASVFFALAFFTKQSSAFVLPFLVVTVYAWYSIKHAAVFFLVSGLIIGIVFFILQIKTGGNFYFYTMQMAGSHDFNWHRIDVFLLDNLLFSVPVLFFLSLYFVYAVRGTKGQALGWLALLVGFASMSAISRMYAGGVYNVLMPFYMLLALMGAAGLGKILALTTGWIMTTRAIVVTLFLSLNFAWGWYDPAKQIPTADAKAFGDALVAEIANVNGRVCLTKDGYLAYLAGKDFCAHNALVADVMNGGDAALAETLAADVRQKLKSGYYEVIVMNNPSELTGFDIPLTDIPYTAHVLPFDRKRFTGFEFNPVVAGPSPGAWLVFNGQGWKETRQ